MDEQHILPVDFPLELANRFNEGLAFNVPAWCRRSR